MENANAVGIAELKARVETLEREAKENAAAHEAFRERLEKIENGHGVLKQDLLYIQNLCSEIKDDVKTLKDRPAKRYESIISTVLQWLVVAILAAVVVFK